MLPDSLVFTNNVCDALSDFFAQNDYSQVLVLTDTNTERDCFPIVKPAMPIGKSMRVAIPPGEEHKKIETVVSLWDGLTRKGFDRKALVVNLGGGVLGDMGGFTAATYKRGIDFINIPTTLLSQVDASVGGKQGIDFEGFKNQIGVFQNPKQVFLDPVFLKTLPERELRSGYAEVLKHALIADKSYWATLTAKPWKEHGWGGIIQHSVGVKWGVVEQDPTEKGLRKTLNFGHTIGHAIESYFLKAGPRLLHGEAIAIGMIAENYLSAKMLNVSEPERDEINRYLLEVYGHVELPDALLEQVVELASHDKKNEGAVIQASLLKEVGNCTYNIPIGGPDILDSLFYYRSLKEY